MSSIEASKARSAISYTPEEIFQKSWQTYQLVVDSGLLGHAKLASAIARALSDLRRNLGRPLRILDLGSGDAGVLTRALAAEAAKASSSDAATSDAATSDAATTSPSSSNFVSPADFVAQYTAVDESRPALELAAKNVAENLPGCEGRFFVGDFLSAAEAAAAAAGGGEGRGGGGDEEAAAAGGSDDPPSPPPPPPPGGYDAIVASLSAHHLSTEIGKPALVAAARRALVTEPLPPSTTTTTEKPNDDGDDEKAPPSSSSPPSPRSLFIVADVFLEEDRKTEEKEQEEEEERSAVAAWRARSCAVIREQWPRREPALSSDEAARIASHVGACDIPTTFSNYERMAREAGFSTCEKVADVCEELGIRVVVMES